jgi:hypothetical protein
MAIKDLITTIEVKTFQRILRHASLDATSTCNGDYVFTGIVISEKTIPVYEHRCNQCGDAQNFDKRFPELIYERRW